MSKPILVFAGSKEQFDRWRIENWPLSENAIYGRAPETIRSIEASKIEVTGTFWDRKDALDLYKVAQSRVR